MTFRRGDRSTAFDVSDVDADLARRARIDALLDEAAISGALATDPCAIDLAEIVDEIREVVRA